MTGLAMDITIDGVPTFDSNLNKNITTTYLNNWACEYEYAWRSVDYECKCE